MAKIFLDLGVHNGQTLEMGIKTYPHFDRFIGIEPVTSLCEKAIGRCSAYKDKNIKVYNIALDSLSVLKKTITFYEDTSKGNHQLGSSLFSDKTMRTNKKVEVMCWDVNHFFRTNFKDNDQVVMKIDVEGAEYRIFDALITSGLLKKHVIKIFAEWHWNKVPSISKDEHNRILIALNKLGYNLKGKSKLDEFYNGF